MPKLIKQAIVYRAELPGADSLEKHLAELPYQKIAEVELSRTSFVPSIVTNELVSTFPSGFSFSLRYDEKILPNASVKEVAKERIASTCRMHGVTKLPKSVRQEIEDDTRLELAKTALVRTTVVSAYYHITSNTLIVATSSAKMANILVARLVHVVGSVKTTTINISDIKNGLTTRLQNHLHGQNGAFEDEGFELGGQVKLVRDGENVSYSLDDLDKSSEGILLLIDAGFKVDRLGLVNSGVAFNLTNAFHFKGIDFDEDVPEEDEEASDPVHDWRVAAGTQTVLLDNVVTSLCDLLGYKTDDQAE